MIYNWNKYGIEIPYGRTSGHIRTTCPKCSADRKKKYDKCLSINLDEGVFHCHNCGWEGSVAEEEEFEKAQRIEEWKKQHKPMKKKIEDYKLPTHTGNNVLSEKAIDFFAGRGISKKTLEDMRITEGLEMMPRPDNDPGEGFISRNTVQFNYYLNGQLINTKFRTGDKKFKMVSGARLIPYNIDSIKGLSYCIITEGEFDAISFHEIGYTSVVSVPSGANANLEWLDDFIEDYFDDKETIYIASDTDSKGVMLKDELVRRFGIERCKVITNYGEGCKDANDVLQHYNAETLKNILEKADFIPVEGVFAIRDFEKDLDALYEKGLRKGCTLGYPNLDEKFSLETKRLCIVTGIPGMGKSEFIDQIAERLNIRYGWKSAFFSPENAPKQLHASKIISKLSGLQFGKNFMSQKEYNYTKSYVDNNFYYIFPSDNFKLDNILEKAKYLVRRYGVKMVVIDPYNRLESEQGNQAETKYISELLDKLTNFAQINDVLMVLMAHPAKQKKNEAGIYDVPTLYDISGSANFYNKADFGLTIHRDFEENITRVCVQKVKFKHLGEPATVTFKYDVPNGRYIPYTTDAEQFDYSDEIRGYIQHKVDGTIEIHDSNSHIGYSRSLEENLLVSASESPKTMQQNTNFDNQGLVNSYDAQFENDNEPPF